MPHDNKLRKFLGAGIPIAGELTGTGLALAAGGVHGALAGAAITPVVSAVIADFVDRNLSQNEKARVSATIEFAGRRISHRLGKGDTLRSDGFFEAADGDRAPAAEIAEGVLTIAQREYEERKLPFLAHLLANLAFEDSIDRGHANTLLRIAERLSYRQLLLLGIFSNKQSWKLRDKDYSFEQVNIGLVPVLTELLEIEQLSLLNASGSVLMGATNIAPARMNVEGAGSTLYMLMHLSELRREDLNEVARMLM